MKREIIITESENFAREFLNVSVSDLKNTAYFLYLDNETTTEFFNGYAKQWSRREEELRILTLNTPAVKSVDFTKANLVTDFKGIGNELSYASMKRLIVVGSFKNLIELNKLSLLLNLDLIFIVSELTKNNIYDLALSEPENTPFERNLQGILSCFSITSKENRQTESKRLQQPKRKIYVTTPDKLAKKAFKHVTKTRNANIAFYKNLSIEEARKFNDEYTRSSQMQLLKTPFSLENKAVKCFVPFYEYTPTGGSYKPAPNALQRMKDSNIQEIVVIGNFESLREFARLAKELNADLTVITTIGEWENFQDVDSFNRRESSYVELITSTYKIKFSKGVQDSVTSIPKVEEPESKTAKNIRYLDEVLQLFKEITPFVGKDPIKELEKEFHQKELNCFGCELKMYKQSDAPTQQKSYGKATKPIGVQSEEPETKEVSFNEFLKTLDNPFTSFDEDEIEQSLDRILRIDGAIVLNASNKDALFVREVLYIVQKWIAYKKQHKLAQ